MSTFQQPPLDAAAAASRRRDLKSIAYWLSLGASAGALGGALVGGIGGRLAMFVLRLTSDSSVRGLTSDDGFTIGRFDLVQTLNLIAVTAALGAIVGLLVIAGRPFLPKRWMSYAWALAGGTAGGAILIHSDGVDFRALGPHWLALGLFVLVPALGAGTIARLTELYPQFWCRDWRTTAVAAVPALPAIVFFPIAVTALLVGCCWWAALRVEGARALPEWEPTRVAAILVFAIVTALGILDLLRDARAIL